VKPYCERDRKAAETSGNARPLWWARAAKREHWGVASGSYAALSHAVEVDLVKILELLPDGQNLLVSAGVNWNPGVVGHATISAEGGSAAGHALRTDAPVISDVATERRFKIPSLLIEHRVKNTVNVVIRGEPGPFGVLEVDSRQHRSFGQDDIDFLDNYANLLASAIDRVNKQKELEASVKKQEVLLDELHHRVNNMLPCQQHADDNQRCDAANPREKQKHR
jgi:GAF domain-containing protein